jgi:hypothetical protein
MNRRGLFKFLGGAAAAAPVIVAMAASAEDAQRRSQERPPPTGQTFAVKERFGVAHPDQLLTFAGALGPATQRLLKDGAEVPFQVAGDSTIVRAAGGIAANTTHTWEVVDGARSAASQVSVIDGGDHWQVDNGLVAFKTPKTIAVGAPVNLDPENPGDHRIGGPLPLILAPLQGVRHRDGTWTGTGPNYLYNAKTYRADWSQGDINFSATSATVTVLESGPLRARVKVSYQTPSWRLRNVHQTQYLVQGYYHCTFTLEAGQQTIMVDEDYDVMPKWYIDMNVGVSADRARYRGHGASSAVFGHNADGTKYEPTAFTNVDCDAEINLGAPSYPVDELGRTLQPPLWIWFTWGENTGYYWYAFNSAGAANSNIWGIFQGPTTRQHDGHSLGTSVGMYSASGGVHGLRVVHDNMYIAGNRKYSFGIYLGSKAADVPPAVGNFFSTAPGIAKAFNLHAGTAQLRKQIGWGVDFPDPTGGWLGLYLSRADTEALFLAAQNDPEPNPHGSGIWARLYNEDPNYRDMWLAVADPTTALARRIAMTDAILTDITTAINTYVNLATHHNHWWQYWGGMLTFQRRVIQANVMLCLDQLQPFMTAAQKSKIKITLSAIGHIVWDNDFVPIDNFASGFHLGTANMPIQYNEFRRMIAIVLKDHSQFSARFDAIVAGATGTFTSQVNTSGAPIGSPHYAGATIIPATDVFRQLQVAGVNDLFAPASPIHSRLVNLAEWCMQVMTPKQSRFGNVRKMVCYGDGSSEGHDLFLSLIMGLEAHNLTLSRRMVGAWNDMGKPWSSFYGSSAMKIRHGFPSQDPALGDADIPGYMTVVRSGWGTANESAVFLVHGDHYNDHHNYERGSPAIHLLRAPLSIMYGSLYEPQIVGPYSASTYIPVSKIAGVWNEIPENLPGAWANHGLNVPCGDHDALFSDTYIYSITANRADLTCHFAVSGWQRKLTFYRDVVTQPIVRLRDSDTVAGDSVFSLNMMATGAVTKPDGGTITPTTFTGVPFAISNGAQFRFTGQWGVSWDLYYLGPSAEAIIIYWGHSWHPGREEGQYQVATGQPFEEKQYILRIKTAGPSDVVIIPYLTGQRPGNLGLTQVAGGLQVGGTGRPLAD